MSFGLLNLVVLFGLAALAVPVLIHLLNRRRYDVVDWGAMQFLQLGRSTRRRLLLEELLLLALRMGLIGLMVLALAAPFVAGPVLADLGGRPSRDVVLVLDGSASMGRDDGSGKTPQQAARAWAAQFLGTLAPGDGVALLVAQQQVLPILPELTHDRQLVRDLLDRLPRPAGGCDAPGAVQEAQRLLARGKRPAREIILLTAGQRHGWADPDSLLRWERLAGTFGKGADKPGEPTPRLWVVTLRQGDKAQGPIPNYAVRPLRPGRGVAWVGQRLRVETALAVTGQQTYEPPYRLRLEADGQDAGTLGPPAKAALQNGQLPFHFSHRFAAPGSHLLSVVVEPDPPQSRRPTGKPLKDQLPADNRQDLAVEVADALPVLLVDGDDQLTPASSTYFLRKALDPSPDPRQPAAVRARAVPLPQFTPAALETDSDPGKPGSRPRVLVLADVPGLSAVQAQAVERFLDGGGGVLVVLGERAARAADYYNRELYQDGKGWLPARLDGVAGDVARPEQGAAVDRKQLHHPALDLFRDGPGGSLDRARLPRWYTVRAAERAASVGALLTTGDPLLVERPHGKGKVLLWTAPLDRSWGSTLPGVWEFPVLAHELVYYLADTRSAEHNVQPGQPLRYRPAPDDPAAQLKLPTTVLVYPPDGEPRAVPVARWPLIYDEARAVGVYKLQPPEGRPAYFVAQPDPLASDLTPCSADDRIRIASFVPIHYENDVPAIADALIGGVPQEDLWWVAMIGVLVLLCAEVWLTRRMVAGREA